MTEEAIRDIAAETAEEVVLRIQREAEDRAEQKERLRRQSSNEEIQLTSEPVTAGEEGAAVDAVGRGEEAYWMLVASERRRVDEIRERLSKEGLARLDHDDLQWAWHGEGHDCLSVELLTAARKPLSENEADVKLLGLSGPSLIEFYCLDPLEQLKRLHWAKRLRAADATIPEEVIIEFRHDSFLELLIAEYMKAQHK